jgi:hypothetical protein
MVMESANQQTNHTLGVVENVNVSFGHITVALQIQVVENAPFEVLLGRPFFSLTNCVTEDSQVGDSFITLRDPNTGKRAKFPTHAHKQARRFQRLDYVSDKKTSSEGFP